MMSRPRSLDGLLVLRHATRQELEQKPPQYLRDELERLERLEEDCFVDLLGRLTSMTLKYRTETINQSVLHVDGARRH